jgi:hypothetical protein
MKQNFCSQLWLIRIQESVALYNWIQTSPKSKALPTFLPTPHILTYATRVYNSYKKTKVPRNSKKPALNTLQLTPTHPKACK